MGWNDHHPGIDPGDPDPSETLLGMADEIRQREKDNPECPTCKGERVVPVEQAEDGTWMTDDCPTCSL